MALAFPVVPAASAAASSGSEVQDGLPPGPPVITVLDWNICGSPKPDGTPCRDVSPARKVQEVVGQVEADPDINVIMLQETCLASHTTPLKEALNDLGKGNWVEASWIARYAETGDADGDGDIDVRAGEVIGCPNQGVDHLSGATKAQRLADGGGSAILVKEWPHHQMIAHQMTFPGTETGDPHNDEGGEAFPQGGVCIKDRRFKWIACTAHFAGGADFAELRRKSAEELDDFAQRHRRIWGYRVLFGGDLNMHKDDPDFMTNLTPGRYDTAPPADPDLDHVLFDRAGWLGGDDRPGGVVGNKGGGISDHDYLVSGGLRHKDDLADHSDAEPTVWPPPQGAVCKSNSEVTACWQPDGDKIWVKDNNADGKKAMVEWAASDSAEPYWRSGVCQGLPSADGWGYCQKDDIPEDTDIALRGFVYQDNGDRADWTDPFPTART